MPSNRDSNGGRLCLGGSELVKISRSGLAVTTEASVVEAIVELSISPIEGKGVLVNTDSTEDPVVEQL